MYKQDLLGNEPSRWSSQSFTVQFPFIVARSGKPVKLSSGLTCHKCSKRCFRVRRPWRFGYGLDLPWRIGWQRSWGVFMSGMISNYAAGKGDYYWTLARICHSQEALAGVVWIWGSPSWCCSEILRWWCLKDAWPLSCHPTCACPVVSVVWKRGSFPGRWWWIPWSLWLPGNPLLCMQPPLLYTILLSRRGDTRGRGQGEEEGYHVRFKNNMAGVEGGSHAVP